MKQEQTKALTTSNPSVPMIGDARTLAAIRLDQNKYPRYKNIGTPRRLEWMTSEIKVLASIVRLRDFDVKEAVMMATVLDEMMLCERFISELTLPEIHDAFKNGVFGKYGEFYGISAPNLYGYLESFLKDERKIEAAKIVQAENARKDAERKRLEREEEQKRIREEIEKAKADGSFVPTMGYNGLKLKSVDKTLESLKHRHAVLQQARKIKSGEINF